VYVDPEAAEAVATTSAATTAAPTTTAAAATSAVPLAAASTVGSSGVPMRWVLGAVGVVVAVLAAATALRVRHVAARRSERRWARVHPATAPGRSVADLRRTGELPAVPAEPAAPRPTATIYDHELEVVEGGAAD
jgi:hypothetical protein